MASITSKGIDIEKKEIFQGFGKPPPEGLIPIGDSGIYLSPNVANDKPVSPFDCEQWPDSPYCGGVPWTRTPIGFDLDFGFDGCGAWVQGTPIVGFTKLPQVSAAWRREGECRDRMQPDVKDKILEDIGESVAPEFPSGISRDARVLAVFAYDHYSRYSGIQWPGINWVRKETKIEKYLGKTIPGDFDMILGQNPTLIRSLCTTRHSYVKTVDYTETKSTGETTATQVVETGEFMANMHPNHPYWSQTANNGRRFTHSVTHIGPSQTIWGYAIQDDTFNDYIYSTYVHGIYGDIVDYYSRWNLGQVYGGVDYFYVNCRLVDLYIFDWGSQPPKAPPPDYKKRKCDCMQCCGSGQAQDRRRDQDNAELLKYLKRIDKNLGQFPIKVNIFDADETKEGAQAKTESLANAAQSLQKTIHEIEKALKCIGIDQLPIFTPSSIIDDESNGILGDLGDLKNQIFKQKIESLAELALWDIKNKYEIFGKWQEVITIEDSDPTKKGNQPKKIVLPNMARTFRELMLLNSIQVKTLGMLFDVSLKMYIDLANTKISAAVSEAILRDIQDYLDYPTEIKKLDVPLGISIPSDNTPNDDREDLERFLRNSTAKAKFDDWTGEGSMTEMLITLLRAAESIIGQNYERLQ